jgi:hypothetical protein
MERKLPLEMFGGKNAAPKLLKIPEKGDANWFDYRGSYKAIVAAGTVYKLLGVKDLGVSNDYMKEKMPPVNVCLLDGQLAWCQHNGGIPMHQISILYFVCK